MVSYNLISNTISSIILVAEEKDRRAIYVHKMSRVQKEHGKNGKNS
jgi:hypothetical protein